jgi:MOSC domain-containing protein YiiM
VVIACTAGSAKTSVSFARLSGMARVLSVNVGKPQTVEHNGKLVTTAIWKHPIAGRIAVCGVNVDGDDQADRSVHGGVDKAVYDYASVADRVAQQPLLV